jgi:ribosomal protein L29
MLSQDELKNLNLKEIYEELEKNKLTLYKLRLLVSSRQSKETAKLKDLRHYIARLHTKKNLLKLEAPKKTPKSDVVK